MLRSPPRSRTGRPHISVVARHAISATWRLRLVEPHRWHRPVSRRFSGSRAPARGAAHRAPHGQRAEPCRGPIAEVGLGGDRIPGVRHRGPGLVPGAQPRGEHVVDHGAEPRFELVVGVRRRRLDRAVREAVDLLRRDQRASRRPAARWCGTCARTRHRRRSRPGRLRCTRVAPRRRHGLDRGDPEVLQATGVAVDVLVEAGGVPEQPRAREQVGHVATPGVDVEPHRQPDGGLAGLLRTGGRRPCTRPRGAAPTR